jgi:hypothetical protein
MSGLSASGSGYCVIAFTGGGGTGATASVALPFVSGTSPTTIMSTGYGYTAPPSAAMVIAGGTATGCMGTSVGVTTYLNGVLNMLATSKPGGPATGNGSVWFDIATTGDWPLPVPMGIDSTGNYISAMVRMNEGSSTGPYYWGVGGVQPTATWMVYDTNSGVTSEVIQAGSTQGSNNIWAVDSYAGSPLWNVAGGGNLVGHGSGGGAVAFEVPSTTFTGYNFILPTGAGSSGQILTSGGGSSPTTWSAVGAAQLPNNTAATWFGANGGATTIASSATEYMAAGFSGAGTTVGTRTWTSPVVCTLRNFYVYALTSNSSTSGSFVFTIYDNGGTPGTVGSPVGTPSNLSVSFAHGAAAGVQSDTTDSAVIAAGDTLTVVVTNNGNATSNQIGPWGLMCEPN